MADQVATLARQLSDPALDQESRDQAARRLLTIGTNESRTAVLNALRDLTSPGGRLAAARAVADDGSDPAFIDPLFVLIDTEPSRPLMDAAAIALGNYKAVPEVTARLINLTDARRSAAVRLSAIHGLSTQVNKQAAGRLVALAQEAGSPEVAAAAVTALQSLTLQPFETAADWADWWQGQSGVSDDRFRLDVLYARMTRAEQELRHGDETYQELSRSVLAQLDAAPRDQRGDVLTQLLRSPREAVRLIAIGRAVQYSADLPASVRPVIRTLLSDVSPAVRIEAARIVQQLNDAEAFAAVAQQAAVEPDSHVRAKLADALGTLGNVDALPLLRSMLDDPSNLVVQSSASALEKLGPALVQAKPREAEELAIRLQRLLTSRPAAATRGTLRDALVGALVPLKQRSLMPMFANMLTQQPPESDGVRGAAARALGVIGDPAVESVLVDALSDPSPDVRLEVVRAIGNVSKDFSNAPRLAALLDPSAEPDEKVRTAAWNVIRSQLPIAPIAQLAAWPDRNLIKGHNDRLLEVYGVLAQRYEAAGQRDEQTDALQHMAECYMNLGDAAELADDRDTATTHFTEASQIYAKALAIAKQTGPAMREETLTVWQMRALLRARDYVAATVFQRSLSPEYQSVVGPEWKLEAARLAGRHTAVDDATALNLITAATQIGSALPSQYVAQLREIRAGIETRQNEKNQFEIPDWMRAVCMIGVN